MLYGVELNGYVVESVALLCMYTTAFLRIELHTHVTTAVVLTAVMHVCSCVVREGFNGVERLVCLYQMNCTFI